MFSTILSQIEVAIPIWYPLVGAIFALIYLIATFGSHKKRMKWHSKTKGTGVIMDAALEVLMIMLIIIMWSLALVLVIIGLLLQGAWDWYSGNRKRDQTSPQ